MSKKKSLRPVAAETEAKVNTCLQYSEDFDECQAEKIFKHDTKLLYIGAMIILICYTLARLGGLIA